MQRHSGWLTVGQLEPLEGSLGQRARVVGYTIEHAHTRGHEAEDAREALAERLLLERAAQDHRVRKHPSMRRLQQYGRARTFRAETRAEARLGAVSAAIGDAVYRQ